MSVVEDGQARTRRDGASAMLEEFSNMDRITQLQDEIQQLLTIMANSIHYLTTRVNFAQVSEDIPVTKQRNPDKVDSIDEFEGAWLWLCLHVHGVH
jgi:hypothetical protein